MIVSIMEEKETLLREAGEEEERRFVGGNKHGPGWESKKLGCETLSC